MNSIVINNQNYHYQVTFKDIKHLYIRFNNDIFQVSCSKRWKTTLIEQFIINNFDKIMAKRDKKNKQIEVAKYQVGNVIHSKEEFYQQLNLRVDDKFYLKALSILLMNKISKIDEQLNQDLLKLGLSKVDTNYKKLKSRYGSCQTIAKTITLNLFLARLDEIYLRYVLIHEYCHLIHPDHSKKFYACLEKVIPEHKTIQKSLRKHAISF